MPLNPSGAISLGGPTAGQSIAVEVGQGATSQISLNDTIVRTLAQVPSGAITMPTNFWGKSISTATQKAIFGFGRVTPSRVNTTNLVSNIGVVEADIGGIGTGRDGIAAATYGGDKALFGFGGRPGPTPAPVIFSMTNLVSNTGVVSSDTPGVGTPRFEVGAASFGGDRAIFAYGRTNTSVTTALAVSNLVSNTGVVSSDTPGVGATRMQTQGATYGGDKGIFAYGMSGTPSGPAPGIVQITTVSLVSNTGVIASDAPGVGTARYGAAATGYGGDKAIFAWGQIGAGPLNTQPLVVNLVSNTGVVAANTSYSAPSVENRVGSAGAGYGGDKAIIGFGSGPTGTLRNTTNLVSNTGVLAALTTSVGRARTQLGAAGFSFT